MNASIGFADAVTPVGTAGRTTDCSDHSRAALLANCSSTLSFAPASCGAATTNRDPSRKMAQKVNRIGLPSVYHRGHNHLEQSANSIVPAHWPIVKLIVRHRLPAIPRMIDFVRHRQPRQLRIELSIVA